MVPMIVSPKKKGETAGAPREAEPEQAAQKRERKREEDANLRRHVNGLQASSCSSVWCSPR